MRLELITNEPKNQSRRHPILFVHGVYHDARCWDEFMSYFSEHGYRCHALSLRGHGKSDGAEVLAQTRFSDYLEDVTRATQQLEESPILIGHSLGGMLVQKYIERHLASAAICISTPTARSLMAASLKLMRRFPKHMLKMMATFNPDHVYKNPKIVKTLFFSDDLPDDKFNEFLRRLLQQNESRRLFLDVVFVRFSQPVKKTPMLVIGGGNDFGVNASAFRETAARYGTKPVILDGMSHDMMIGNNWKAVANQILGWLNQERV